MNAEDIRKGLGRIIFDQLYFQRVKADGWFAVAEFLEAYIIPSNDWANDPNIISCVELAIKDLWNGIRQERTSPDARMSLVEEMQAMKEKLIRWLESNGKGMLDACKLKED